MAKKKVDISGMYAGITQAHDMHTIEKTPVQSDHQKYKSFRESEILATDSSNTKPKRINMAFNSVIYDQIITESNLLGLSLMQYVNDLIRTTTDEEIKKCYDSKKLKPSKDYIARRKGNPAKRITIKFFPDVRERIEVESQKYNVTMTQFVNLVIEASTR